MGSPYAIAAIWVGLAFLSAIVAARVLTELSRLEAPRTETESLLAARSKGEGS